MYIIQTDLEVSEEDIVSLSPVPGPNTIFQFSNSTLYQLSQEVSDVL